MAEYNARLLQLSFHPISEGVRPRSVEGSYRETIGCCHLALHILGSASGGEPYARSSRFVHTHRASGQSRAKFSLFPPPPSLS